MALMVVGDFNVNVDDEPKTGYVDELTLKVKAFKSDLPCAIIGIGVGGIRPSIGGPLP